MKNKIKAFFRRPRIINPEFKTNCQCVIVDDNPELDNTWTVMGVTESRQNEIAAFCRAEFENDRNLAEMIVEISKQCKHPNELALASMLVGKWYQQRTSNPLAGLFSFIRP